MPLLDFVRHNEGPLHHWLSNRLLFDNVFASSADEITDVDATMMVSPGEYNVERAPNERKVQ